MICNLCCIYQLEPIHLMDILIRIILSEYLYDVFRFFGFHVLLIGFTNSLHVELLFWPYRFQKIHEIWIFVNSYEKYSIWKFEILERRFSRYPPKQQAQSRVTWMFACVLCWCNAQFDQSLRLVGKRGAVGTIKLVPWVQVQITEQGSSTTRAFLLLSFHATSLAVHGHLLLNFVDRIQWGYLESL